MAQMIEVPSVTESKRQINITGSIKDDVITVPAKLDYVCTENTSADVYQILQIARQNGVVWFGFPGNVQNAEAGIQRMRVKISREREKLLQRNKKIINFTTSVRNILTTDDPNFVIVVFAISLGKEDDLANSLAILMRSEECV